MVANWICQQEPAKEFRLDVLYAPFAPGLILYCVVGVYCSPYLCQHSAQ